MGGLADSLVAISLGSNAYLELPGVLFALVAFIGGFALRWRWLWALVREAMPCKLPACIC